SVVELAPSRHHRSSVLPSRSRTVQVNGLYGCRGQLGAGSRTRIRSTWTSTSQQHFAIIIHHCRTPVTCSEVIISNKIPSPGAGHVKVSRCLTWPGIKYFAIRRYKHEWIKG